jgi:hypothetical protein
MKTYTIREYTPGRPTKRGGAEREKNYSILRSENFTKKEAIELSKNKGKISDNPVILEMIRTRRRLVNTYLKGDRSESWSKTIRKFYHKNRLADLAGMVLTPNSVRKFYHVAENKLAKQRGWKKGEYDKAIGDIKNSNKDPETKAKLIRKLEAKRKKEETERRPDKKSYPKRPRGQVKIQKARANARASFYKRTDGKLKIDILEREYKGSFKLIADAKTPTVRRDMVDRQIQLKQRLDKAQKAGVKYG